MSFQEQVAPVEENQEDDKIRFVTLMYVVRVVNVCILLLFFGERSETVRHISFDHLSILAVNKKMTSDSRCTTNTVDI